MCARRGALSLSAATGRKAGGGGGEGGAGGGGARRAAWASKGSHGPGPGPQAAAEAGPSPAPAAERFRRPLSTHRARASGSAPFQYPLGEASPSPRDAGCESDSRPRRQPLISRVPLPVVQASGRGVPRRPRLPAATQLAGRREGRPGRFRGTCPRSPRSSCRRPPGAPVGRPAVAEAAPRPARGREGRGLPGRFLPHA